MFDDFLESIVLEVNVKGSSSVPLVLEVNAQGIILGSSNNINSLKEGIFIKPISASVSASATLVFVKNSFDSGGEGGQLSA